jgi:Ecdysteroid kinase-like family
MANFPTNANELTPEHLTRYLQESGSLDRGNVTGVSAKIIGTGKMGDNARLQISYEDAAGDAPETLIAKFPASDEQARAMAGAQGAYYNEVMFYRELAPRTTMHTPKIFGSELSEDRTEFILLMEDMAPAEPGSQLVGESREHATQVLTEAAKLAAAFYGDESVVANDYVITPARDDGGEFGAALMEQSWPGFLDRFGAGLSPEAIDFGEHYVANHLKFVKRFTGPKTVAHGDLRSENVLFGPAAATVVDWQTVGESSVLTDAAYFLGGSLDVEDRRDWEEVLIRDHYRAALDAAGVSLGAQECWDQYREFAMHGILITVLGASFSTPEERSDKMFLAMIQRHLQHCIDLDSREFLSG